MSDVPLMSGFPPAEASQVTLANWQDPPFNRWAFQHLREVIPTHRISRGRGPVRPLEQHPQPLASDAVVVQRLDGSSSTLAAVLAETWTDAVVIVHDGRIVLESYANGMAPDTPHIMMSVTKSVVGCVAGILAERGSLDPDEQISTYVPEVTGSGYGGATVRNLLDMRTGVAFSEEYTNPQAEVRVMERYMGWRPGVGDDAIRGMYAYMTTLAAGSAHGGPFVYRSADTDMLGWVCERAAGTRMAELISTLIWQPIGAEFDAEITCDGVGSAIHDGGMSARARDLARFGQLLLDDGVGGRHPGHPEAMADRGAHHRSRQQGGVRGLGLRAVPDRRVVSQPVLVHAGVARGPAGGPGNPRPDGAGGPGDAHRVGEVLVMAGRPGAGLPARHRAGLRRGGPARGRACDRRPPSGQPQRTRSVWSRAASAGTADPSYLTYPIGITVGGSTNGSL